MSCLEEASASELSPGGLSVPVGCPVPVLFLSCPVCLAPEGSWYPLTTPGNFFGGVEGFRLEWPGRGTRPWPRRPPAMASRAPCTCHGLQSSQLRHGLQSSQLHHGLLSSQLRHGLRCLFRSGGPRPVFLSMSVLRGLQSTHPLSLVELLRRGTRLPGGGSYVRVLLCVSCVPASCVHIWFVSCPRLMWLLVNSCPAVFMWLCVNYPVYLVPVFWV